MGGGRLGPGHHPLLITNRYAALGCRDGAGRDGFAFCVCPGRAAARFVEYVEHHFIRTRAGRAATAADGGSPTTVDDPGTKSAPVVAPARAVRGCCVVTCLEV